MGEVVARVDVQELGLSMAGEVCQEAEGAFAVAQGGGLADGFGDEVLGAADGFDRSVAED